MTKKILFRDIFLIPGIMCHQGCGVTIQGALETGLHALKQDRILPLSAHLIIDAEPHTLGLHRLSILVECDEHEAHELGERSVEMTAYFKRSLGDVGFEVMDDVSTRSSEPSNHVHQLNMLVNMIAMGCIMALSVIFPPSLWLTMALTGLSFLTTAFTARHYLIDFYNNLRNKNTYNMATTITLGWLLSLTHTLYHAITMPLMGGFPMIWMNFIMPVVLVFVINGMDELKRRVSNALKKMQLSGMNALFPQMASAYPRYSLSQEQQLEWSTRMDSASCTLEQLLHDMPSVLEQPVFMEQKNALKKGMIIQVRRGECFPVDCLILQGHTQVNASVLTGEHQQGKRPLNFVPAGAVNLSQTVTVYAMNDAYNSTVNQLLFVANRANETRESKPNQTFLYLYSGLIGLGVLASILAPVVFGTFTVSVLLQNVTGILFAVCPCTMAIAHELPKVLSRYYRGRKGILLRNDRLTGSSDDIHTIVFDKTGTLTTGLSEVESSECISHGLWERIYLLEKHHGAEHPLASAIVRYYEHGATVSNMINDIHGVCIDSNHRGLSAQVQGKRIHVGNAAFLEQSGIAFPTVWPASIQDQFARGYSPVYIAEDGIYQGIIWVKHEISPSVLAGLRRLKKEGKHLILLTGDSALSARGFNQQNEFIFDSNDVYADQTPQQKEDTLSGLMRSHSINPKGVWFVGDGLNDAPCARLVSEQGGVSCAMNADDKAAFFTDIGLNGSLDYLFQHHPINRFLDKIVLQNQGLLLYGAMASLLCILTLSMAGLAVFSLIPLVIMVSTTLFVLFNAYRVNVSIDMALDQKTSRFKQCLAHDGSIGLLVAASALLMGGVLISTLATGTLSVPFMTFTAGLAVGISSGCILTAGMLLMAFMVCGMASLWLDHASTLDAAVGLAEGRAGSPIALQGTSPDGLRPASSQQPARRDGLSFYSPVVSQYDTPPLIGGSLHSHSPHF